MSTTVHDRDEDLHFGLDVATSITLSAAIPGLAAAGVDLQTALELFFAAVVLEENGTPLRFFTGNAVIKAPVPTSFTGDALIYTVVPIRYFGSFTGDAEIV